MKVALGARDVTRVYRLLQKVGFSQQRIAALTGQSQPEVSAIIHGRRVMAYDVLARIAEGLGIPRGSMGLAYVDASGMLVPPPDLPDADGGTEADGARDGSGAAEVGYEPGGYGPDGYEPEDYDGRGFEVGELGAGGVGELEAGGFGVGEVGADGVGEVGADGFRVGEVGADGLGVGEVGAGAFEMAGYEPVGYGAAQGGVGYGSAHGAGAYGSARAAAAYGVAGYEAGDYGSAADEVGGFWAGRYGGGGFRSRAYGAGGAGRGSVGRRAFLGQAAAITVGAAVIGAELVEAPPAAADAGRVPVPAPARIGMSDVRQIQEATDRLRGLDYLHGGGACRDAAAAQLSWAEGLLHSDAPEQVGRQLRIAVADLRNLVGWTSLDIGQPTVAEHHFLRALDMAKHAEEPDLVTNILYRLARVSLPVNPAESVRVYRMARLAAEEAGSPLSQAIVSANYAWALGMLGQAHEADEALGAAEEQMAKANLTQAPSWTRFFDESDLAALQGMTYLALGEHDHRFTSKAVARLQDSAEQRVPEMARSKAFDLTALAIAHYREGDLDHGSAVANAALDAAGPLKSARAIDRLRPLAVEAARRAEVTEVREVGERLTEVVAAMSSPSGGVRAALR